MSDLIFDDSEFFEPGRVIFGADESLLVANYKAQRKSLKEIGVRLDSARKNTSGQLQIIFGEIVTKLPKKATAEKGVKFGEVTLEQELQRQADEAAQGIADKSTEKVTDFLTELEGAANVAESTKKLGDAITDIVAEYGCELLRAAGSAVGSAAGAAAGTALAGPVGTMAGGAGGGAIGGLLGDAACFALEKILEVVDAIFGAIVDWVAGLFEPGDPTEVDDFGPSIRPIGWSKGYYSDLVKQCGAIYMQRLKKRLEGQPPVLKKVWPNKGDDIAIAKYTLVDYRDRQKKYGYVFWYAGPDSAFGKKYELEFEPWAYNELEAARKDLFKPMVPVLDRKLWDACMAEAKKLWDSKRIEGTKITPIERQWLIRRIRELGGGQREWSALYNITGDEACGVLPPPKASRARYDELVVQIELSKGKGDKEAKALWKAYQNSKINPEFVKILVADGYNKPQAMEIVYYGLKARYAEYRTDLEDWTHSEDAVRRFYSDESTKFIPENGVGDTLFTPEMAAFSQRFPGLDLALLFEEYRLARSQIEGLRGILSKGVKRKRPGSKGEKKLESFKPGPEELAAREKVAEQFAKTGMGRAAISMLAVKEFNLLPPKTLFQFDKDIKTGRAINPKFVEAVLQNRKFALSIQKAIKAQAPDEYDVDEGGSKLGPLVGLAALAGLSFAMASPLPAAIGAGAYLLTKKRGVSGLKSKATRDAIRARRRPIWMATGPTSSSAAKVSRNDPLMDAIAKGGKA